MVTVKKLPDAEPKPLAQLHTKRLHKERCRINDIMQSILDGYRPPLCVYEQVAYDFLEVQRQFLIDDINQLRLHLKTRIKAVLDETGTYDSSMGCVVEQHKLIAILQDHYMACEEQTKRHRWIIKHLKRQRVSQNWLAVQEQLLAQLRSDHDWAEMNVQGLKYAQLQIVNLYHLVSCYWLALKKSWYDMVLARNYRRMGSKAIKLANVPISRFRFAHTALGRQYSQLSHFVLQESRILATEISDDMSLLCRFGQGLDDLEWTTNLENLINDFSQQRAGLLELRTIIRHCCRLSVKINTKLRAQSDLLTTYFQDKDLNSQTVYQYIGKVYSNAKTKDPTVVVRLVQDKLMLLSGALQRTLAASQQSDNLIGVEPLKQRLSFFKLQGASLASN